MKVVLYENMMVETFCTLYTNYLWNQIKRTMMECSSIVDLMFHMGCPCFKNPKSMIIRNVIGINLEYLCTFCLYQSHQSRGVWLSNSLQPPKDFPSWHFCQMSGLWSFPGNCSVRKFQLRKCYIMYETGRFVRKLEDMLLTFARSLPAVIIGPHITHSIILKLLSLYETKMLLYRFHG